MVFRAIGKGIAFCELIKIKNSTATHWECGAALWYVIKMFANSGNALRQKYNHFLISPSVQWMVYSPAELSQSLYFVIEDHVISVPTKFIESKDVQLPSA